MIFEIRCFCESKKLGTVHEALDGLVMDLKAIPVRDAEPDKKNEKVQATKWGAKPIAQRAYGFLRAQGHKPGTMIIGHEVRKGAKEIGFQPNSYSYVISKMINAKMLKKIGEGSKTQYKVLTP